MRERQKDSAIQWLAVIADVHAEDVRLQLALEGIAELDVDTIACTGDIVDGYGLVDRIGGKASGKCSPSFVAIRELYVYRACQLAMSNMRIIPSSI